jgi:Asp-tRNA(Asn)/Glu-tRNA(Gln) amidotransferase C subunit
MDAIAKFSSEIEKEFRTIHQRPEVFQVTAFIEPVKSRLVFVGRTEKIEGSMVWLGGLFLYQAWTGYIMEVLEEAALGLKSIRLARSATSLTKTKVMKLSEEELDSLVQDLDRIKRLIDAVNGAVSRIEGTRESAMNFHETLVSMVSDETFEIGLYEPILSANEKHLGMVENEVKEFKEEFRRIAKEVAATAASITDECSRRASAKGASGPNEFRGIRKLVATWLQVGGQKPRSSVYDEQVRLMFATARLVYGVVEGSDIVI